MARPIGDPGDHVGAEYGPRRFDLRHAAVAAIEDFDRSSVGVSGLFRGKYQLTNNLFRESAHAIVGADAPAEVRAGQINLRQVPTPQVAINQPRFDPLFLAASTTALCRGT